MTRLFGHAVIDIFYIYISAFLYAAKQDMINHNLLIYDGSSEHVARI